MQPIVTDPVAWSVCLSVCHTNEPCKRLNRSFEMPFGYGLWWAPRIVCCIDGVLICVGRPILKYSNTLPWSVQKRLNWSRCPRKHALDGAHWPDHPCEGAVIRGKDMLWPELCKHGWTIYLPFALWTRMGQRKHKFSCIRQVAPICPHWRAHSCHLANMIEPSVLGGDAHLC